MAELEGARSTGRTSTSTASSAIAYGAAKAGGADAGAGSGAAQPAGGSRRERGWRAVKARVVKPEGNKQASEQQQQQEQQQVIGGSQDSVVRDPTKRSSIDHLTNLEESVLGREPEGGSSNALESETGDDAKNVQARRGLRYCLACTPFCTALWCPPVAFHCGQRCAIAGGKMEPTVHWRR